MQEKDEVTLKAGERPKRTQSKAIIVLAIARQRSHDMQYRYTLRAAINVQRYCHAYAHNCPLYIRLTFT